MNIRLASLWTGIFLFLHQNAQASAIDQLKTFIQKSSILQADFIQSQQQNKDKVQGTFSLQRPGKFRWIYGKPIHQQIIADGSFLWIYDIDLKQVTRKNIREGLASSPVSFLMGNNNFERDFILKNIPLKKNDSLSWVEITPKKSDQGFDRIQIGMNGYNLSKMIMFDLNGHETQIEFLNMLRPKSFSHHHFLFKAPEGVDVLIDDPL
jgi:outer membrane lipoprotein carrier protein